MNQRSLLLNRPAVRQNLAAPEQLSQTLAAKRASLPRRDCSIDRLSRNRAGCQVSVHGKAHLASTINLGPINPPARQLQNASQ